jgi:hypothetical protein
LSQHQKELDRHFAWFEKKLPPRPAKFVGWVRKPSSIYARIPLAILLVAGGFLSFLPVLGLWMLPLGLLLFAQDVPPLQKPMAQGLGWIERKWLERQRAKLERERAKARMSDRALQRIQLDFVFSFAGFYGVTQKPALLAITWLHRDIP